MVGEAAVAAASSFKCCDVGWMVSGVWKSSLKRRGVEKIMIMGWLVGWMDGGVKRRIKCLSFLVTIMVGWVVVEECVK